MRKKSFLIVTGLALLACNGKKTMISDLSWMEGKWEGTAGGMSFFEEWKLESANKMNGIGGAISGKDTVFSEHLALEQRGDELFYVPTVKENGGAVDFKYAGSNQDSIVFENPAHDFPQRIVYFRLSDTKLYACIDGVEGGKYKRVEFSYHKAD